jgi:hypothetical protein
MAEDSGYYTADEATKRLARKRQLARLLEEQSMKFSLVNPHARASWTNVGAPLAEALVGRLKGEEADTEGKAQEAKARQDQIDWWNAGKPEPDLPVRPDMNLPGDLRDLAGQDYPEPLPSSTLPATTPQGQGAPFAPPEMRPNALMAQLLMGQTSSPSLGDKLAQDQGSATISPEDLKPPLLPAGPTEPPAPAMVPKPVEPTRINIGGVSPAQAKIDEAIVKADMAKRGLDPTNVVRGPAPPEEQGTPPPTLAGPIVPGAMESTPPLVPQPPEASVAPPPAPPGPALLPNGQIDMAPRGLVLPTQKGRNLDAYEMVDRAMAMPPGRQREEFVAAALKSALTEPDRRLAKEELDLRKREELATRKAIAAGAEAGKTTRTGMQQTGATARTEATNKSREQIAADRLAAVHTPGSEATPEAISDAAALFKKTGVMPALGWDKDTRRKILNEWSKQMREDGQTVDDVTTAAAEFKAQQSSQRQLTQRYNAIEAGAKKIHNDFATLETQIDSGNFGGPKIINTPVNKLRGLVSDPDLRAFELAAQVVGTEYERMMTGGLLSIAQLHEGAREDAKRLLNGDMSPAEMRSVMTVMKQEIANQRNSWKDQLGEISESMKKTGRAGSAAPASGTAPAVDTAALEKEARAAIAEGRPAAAVRARFKQLTGKDLP